MDKKPTTTRKAWAAPIYFCSTSPIMEAKDVDDALRGQEANKAVMAVLSMLDEEIATQTGIVADPSTVNRDHAAGHAYGLLVLAREIRARL